MHHISGISSRSRCRFRRSWLPPVVLRGAAEKAQGAFHVFGLLVEQDKRANGGEVVSSAEIILRFLERGDEFIQGKIERRAECLCDGAGHCGLRASGAKASSSMNSGKRLSSSSVTSTMRRATAFRESGSIGLKSSSICRLLFCLVCPQVRNHQTGARPVHPRFSAVPRGSARRKPERKNLWIAKEGAAGLGSCCVEDNRKRGADDGRKTYRCA